MAGVVVEAQPSHLATTDAGITSLITVMVAPAADPLLVQSAAAFRVPGGEHAATAGYLRAGGR